MAIPAPPLGGAPIGNKLAAIRAFLEAAGVEFFPENCGGAA